MYIIRLVTQDKGTTTYRFERAVEAFYFYNTESICNDVMASDLKNPEGETLEFSINL